MDENGFPNTPLNYKMGRAYRYRKIMSDQKMNQLNMEQAAGPNP
jgi:hypothetical protein